METGIFEKVNEVSFDFTDENNVTHVDLYRSDEEDGFVGGYIINGEFYPTKPEILSEDFIMGCIKEFIKESTIKELSKLEKAQAQLEDIDVETIIENGTLYVCVGYGTQLELSQFEIDFRATLYDEEQSK